MGGAFGFGLPQDPYGELNKFATTKEVTDGTGTLATPFNLMPRQPDYGQRIAHIVLQPNSAKACALLF